MAGGRELGETVAPRARRAGRTRRASSGGLVHSAVEPRARRHRHGQCPGPRQVGLFENSPGAGQRVHRRLTRCRAALATGPASLCRRQLVDEHSPLIDDGHLVFAPCRKIGTHGHRLRCRVCNHNRDRRVFRDADYLVRQHIDGLRERWPERHGDDADGTGIRHLDNKGLGHGTAHRQHPRGSVEAEEPGSAPVATGTTAGLEVERDAVGTSSRGATAQTAVKARTMTPSLARVN